MSEVEEWRVTTVLRSPEHATQLLTRLTQQGAIEAGGGSCSVDGRNTFTYGDSHASIERYVAEIRSTLDALGIEAVRVTIDKWLPEQSRWGDPNSTPSAEESDDGDDDPPEKKQGWISTIIDGLTGSAPV